MHDEFRLFTAPTGLIDLIGVPMVRAVAAGYGLDPGEALVWYAAARTGRAVRHHYQGGRTMFGEHAPMSVAEFV